MWEETILNISLLASVSNMVTAEYYALINFLQIWEIILHMTHETYVLLSKWNRIMSKYMIREKMPLYN